MAIDVQVVDEQDRSVSREALKKLARFVLAKEKVDAAEMSLVFVTKGRIHELNRTYREIDEPTDVLAFGQEGELLATETAALGDVIISPEVAEAQAAKFDATTEEEIELLVVHGVLHLLGYDHENVKATRRMRAREREILYEFHGQEGRQVR